MAPTTAFGFLPLDSETGRLIATIDWSSTPIGAADHWPQSLRTATTMVLRSPVPIVMLWGVDGIMLYNDAYSEFAGLRQPLTLTLPARRAVGLIGHNGSGKSTLVKLLARQQGSAGYPLPR